MQTLPKRAGARKQNLRPLFHMKKEGQRKWRMAAFDLETKGLHGQVNFGTAQWELEPNGDRSPVHSVLNEHDLLDLMIANNASGLRWYAHNGGGYDFHYLIQSAFALQRSGLMGPIEPQLRGDRQIYKVAFHVNGAPPLEVYDSMAVAANGGQGLPLKKFAAGFSKIGGKLDGPNFDAGEEFDPSNAAHRAYAIRDTEALLDALVNFNAAIHEHFGVNIKGTIGGTAMKAWQCSLPEERIANESMFFRLPRADYEEAAREAYSGGFVFLTTLRQHTDVVSLDVNSMYPHCMRRFGVPCGETRYVTEYKDGSDGRCVAGIYDATFTAPADMQMGCVAFRDDDGVCWPRGQFRAWAWNIDVARAKRWGYRVKIHSGFLFDRIAYPFSDFVTYCESKRREFKGQAVEMIFKTMQNSLYGKFGTKPDATELLIEPPRDLGTAAERMADGRNIWKHLTDAGWQMFTDDKGKTPHTYLWERPVDRSLDCNHMLPHWAGWITAQARGILLDAIEVVQAAGGRVLQGDTDSLKLERRYVEILRQADKVQIGSAYGQWKVDAEYDVFHPGAPKCYSARKGKVYSGAWKGIPKKLQTEAFHKRVLAGERPKVRFASSPNLLGVLRGGEHALKVRTRQVSELDHSCSWFRRGSDVVAVQIHDGARLKS